MFYGGVTALFVMQVALFIPLGHLVGRGFIGLPRLAAYSTNILGGLAGIFAYNLLTCSYTGPCLWFLVGSLPVFWLIRDRKRELALSAALLIGAFAVLGHTLLPRTWSMYNRISLNDSYLWMRPDGTSMISPLAPSDLKDAQGREGKWVNIHKRLDVADIYYMDITDLSESFVRQYPRFYGEDIRLYSYNPTLHDRASEVRLRGRLWGRQRTWRPRCEPGRRRSSRWKLTPSSPKRGSCTIPRTLPGLSRHLGCGRCEAFLQ